MLVFAHGGMCVKLSRQQETFKIGYGWVAPALDGALRRGPQLLGGTALQVRWKFSPHRPPGGQGGHRDPGGGSERSKS